MLGPAARVVVQKCTATSVSTAWAPRRAGTEPAGSLFFFFDPDNVRLAWFVPALGVSRLPYLLWCPGCAPVGLEQVSCCVSDLS